MLLKLLKLSPKSKNLISCNNVTKLYCTNTADIKKRICIVGSGPAGFYAAQYILKHLDNSYVDLIEKLPVPFGLVRFGVAPDHQEVKNVIHTFSKTAEHPRFSFYGNLTLGKDFTLKELREKYHAVLLTYGANKERMLNIPNETIKNSISAREFVAWYNGLPGAENLDFDLQGKSVCLLGQGNVAIDVARILLSPLDDLKKTDITDYALEALARSNVEKVYLVGRRGPLQAAFTIKELREMIKLPGCSTRWRKEDFVGVQEAVEGLPRPKKRITELMLKSLTEMSAEKTTNKSFEPIFFRSPLTIIGNEKTKAVQFSINKLIDNKAVATDESEIIESDLICRSIGYKSVKMDPDLHFDDAKGVVYNEAGRVLKKSVNTEDKYEKGLYVSGWLGSGPVGVILTTMNNSFSVADNICKDFQNNVISANDSKPGINVEGRRVVTWKGWQKIDSFEVHCGSKLGKPREKLTSIESMLKISDNSAKLK